MEKETATEWLFKQLWEEPKDKFTWNAILSKAKEMEKQQIMDAANKLLYHSTGPSDTAAEQYYNETFKKD
jgi:tRNA A37 threonylcarbamoyladenosine modification protein TsaB